MSEAQPAPPTHPMTATRFRECLGLLGWTLRSLSELLRIHPTTVQRWAMGRQEIPLSVAQWLELRARHAQIHPLPVGWDRRAAA